MTRSHHSSPAEACELPAIHIAGNDGVTFKRVPPKSFVLSQNSKAEALKYSERRKDSAVHVSLSSSSLVKQPGIMAIPPPGEPGSRRSRVAPDRDRKPYHRVSVRCFEDAPSRRGGRRAELTEYIGFRPLACQLLWRENPPPGCARATAILSNDLAGLERVESPVPRRT